MLFLNPEKLFLAEFFRSLLGVLAHVIGKGRVSMFQLLVLGLNLLELVDDLLLIVIEHGIKIILLGLIHQVHNLRHKAVIHVQEQKR